MYLPYGPYVTSFTVQAVHCFYISSSLSMVLPSASPTVSTGLRFKVMLGLFHY